MSHPGAKAPHLNEQELEAYRDRLRDLRARLVGDVSALRDESLRNAPTDKISHVPTHLADAAADEYQERTLEILRSERNVLREIDEALQRIDAGTYGVCEATGEPIPKARLQMIPWARYTVEAARERGQ
jgi:RNA polymerase-binding protein DksA